MKVEADLEQIKLSYREELDSQTEKLLEEINRLKIIVNEKQEMVHDCDKIVENQRLIVIKNMYIYIYIYKYLG